MNYRDSDFLRGHIKRILDFYHPNIVDPDGGFFHNFLDDGSVFNPKAKHLVSSLRMVFNYSKAYQLFADEEYKKRAAHGFDYICQRHWDSQREGYHWTLDNHAAGDQTNHCYGLAFVVLAHCAAAEIGLPGAKEGIEATYQLMERRFWQPEQGLYADEASSDWSELSDYRGQNANMHSCEALLSAYDVTKDVKYLDRAYSLAKRFSVELASKSDGLVWEHFTPEMEVDWEYNKDDPKNLYRPWGFQPGHQTEWTKLLLTLYKHKPEQWMVERAKELFDRSLAISWDDTHGGILYGFNPAGDICDDEKYFWVQAETIASAARLAVVTGDDSYWQWYDKIWKYCDEHMIDHKYGAWYRVLDRQNNKLSNEKSTAGGKCDYHTLGACWDVLQVTSI